MENSLIKRTLDNGMKVYFYPDLKKHAVEVQLVARVGGQSKDFQIDNQTYHMSDGYAHFLEHLLLEHSTYGNLMQIFGEKQMSCNGGTTPTHTTYYFNTVDYVEFGIETLIKGINQKVFTAEDVEKTKNAIYEEIRMRKDSKGRALWERRNQNLFHNIAYINNLGSLDDIKEITYESASFYYDTFYQPNNQFLVIGGNFDVKKIWKLLKEVTCKIKKPCKKIKMIEYNEPNEIQKKEDIIYMPTGEQIVERTYKVNVSSFTGMDKIKLVNYLYYFNRMNFGKSSEIYKKLMKEEVIHDYIQIDRDFQDKFLTITIGSYTNQGDIFLKEIEKVIENKNFDKDLFELYKNQDKMDICCLAESYQSILRGLIQDIIQYNHDELETVEDINELNFLEFQEYINRLDFTNYITLYLIDEEAK